MSSFKIASPDEDSGMQKLSTVIWTANTSEDYEVPKPGIWD